MLHVSTRDCLALLHWLPRVRLCQMLSVLASSIDAAEVWALLAWIEIERGTAEPWLNPEVRARWFRLLLGGRSLERLRNPAESFAAPVFEMITDSVLKPLLGARGSEPALQQFCDILDSWDSVVDQPFWAVGLLLQHLPEPARRRLLAHPGARFLDAALSPAPTLEPHQATALLFQLLLALSQRGYLSQTMRLDLFLEHNLHSPQEWDRLVDGIRDFLLVAHIRQSPN